MFIFPHQEIVQSQFYNSSISLFIIFFHSFQFFHVNLTLMISPRTALKLLKKKKKYFQWYHFFLPPPFLLSLSIHSYSQLLVNLLSILFPLLRLLAQVISLVRKMRILIYGSHFLRWDQNQMFPLLYIRLHLGIIIF